MSCCRGNTALYKTIYALLCACRLLACMLIISTMKAPAMGSCTFLFRKLPKLLMHQPRICTPLSQAALQAGMLAES